MRCADVNVLVYAHRAEMHNHARARAWLEEARRGVEPLGLPGLVVSGFLRVVTHARVFKDPTPSDEALAFVEALLASPAVDLVEPGRRHWHLFRELVAAMRLRGNDVPDAYLAALAIEQGGTWVTTDRGFGRFSGLRLIDPLRGPD
ncbi:MAG: type II toxin-antitoxin system VapC family toxin [Acidimicrobiia bacterium]|nr:type II toxin-antitoxin system VapC family toxin [Acidimicrobiia bacterium]